MRVYDNWLYALVKNMHDAITSSQLPKLHKLQTIKNKQLETKSIVPCRTLHTGIHTSIQRIVPVYREGS